MNELKEKLVPLEPQTEVTLEVKTEIKTEAAPPQEARHKPSAWVNDWEFWRFLLAALSLAWEIAKTWVR